MIKKQIVILSILATSGISAGIEWIDDHEPSFHDQSNYPGDNSIIENGEGDFGIQEQSLHKDVEGEFIAESDFILEDSTPVFGDLKKSIITVVDFDIDDSSNTETKKETNPKDDIQFVHKEESSKEIDIIFASVDFDIDDTAPNAETIKETNPKDDIQFVHKEEPTKEIENIFVDVDFDIEDTSPQDETKKEINPKDNIEFVLKETPEVLEEEGSGELALADLNTNQTQLVEIAEVGPFSEFTIKGESTKLALVSEINDVKSDQHMIYFSPGEDSQCGFYLSSKKVTNGEYEAFIKATHHRPPPHWLGGNIPSGKEKEPVVNVTYKDAFLYSIWAGKRLPKDTELIIAAKADKAGCDMVDSFSEWTSTPSYGKSPAARGASHLILNSELSRITYHKVFMGDPEAEMPIKESNSYNNTLGFRIAINSTQVME